MSDITIYHNPACGTSRNVLALIRNSGEEPKVIEYLKTPPDCATLVGLIQAMGMPVRDVLRQKVRLMTNWALAILNGPTSNWWTSCCSIPS